MPVPTGDGGWIVINNPLNFALNSSPLIKLMAAGWICVGELQQDVERYRAAMDAQLSLLPAAGESSSGVAEAG